MSKYCFISVESLEFRGENRGIFLGNVRGLDAPRLGVEVIGAIADVLDKSEWVPFEAYCHFTTWGVGRQLQGFTTQIGDGLGVSEIDRLTRNSSLGREGGNYLRNCLVHSTPLSIQRGGGGESSFLQHAHKESFATRYTWDESVDGFIEPVEQ